MVTTEQRAVFNAAYKVGVAIGRKFEASDLTPELRQAARLYAATYEGDFDFVLQFRQQCDGGVMFFSDGQSKALLNCLMADARRRMAAKPKAPAAPAAAPAAPARIILASVPNGRYRVTLPSGDHLALRLSDASTDGKLAGSRIVSTRINGDEWMGVADIRSDFRLWRSCAGALRDRVRDAVNVLDQAETQDQWLVAGLAFAQEGSQCFICGRDLDTPESLTAGYGPVCADKHGLPWGAKAIPMSVRLAQATAAPAAPQAPTEPAYTKEEEDEFMALANAPAVKQDAYAEADRGNREAAARMAAIKASGRKLTYDDIFGEEAS